MNSVIEFQNVSKRYGNRWALRDVSFTLEEGKIIGLLGPNGSGKSTIIKLILGFISPTEGSIKVFGEKIGQAALSRIAYTPEFNHLYRWMRVGDVVNFVKSFYPDWDDGREAELREFLEVDYALRVRELSRGMAERVKVLIAFARKAELYLLDEPFSGIDPYSRRKVVDALVKSLRAEGETILFSTHLVHEAEKLFDYVVFLRDGRIVLEGEADRIREDTKKSIEDVLIEISAGEKEGR